MDYTDLCNGCGLCCILLPKSDSKMIMFKDITPEAEDCQYLQRLDNGLTRCRIHGTHTGTVIKQLDDTNVWYCADNMTTPYLYEDCPYNELKIAKQLKEHDESNV